jgi:hypothetical protein
LGKYDVGILPGNDELFETEEIEMKTFTLEQANSSSFVAKLLDELPTHETSWSPPKNHFNPCYKSRGN